mgnify:CR=1 FL=1
MTTSCVTGGTSGIGLAFARALASRGDDLVLVARDEARLQAVADELAAAHGVQVECLVADLAERPDAQRVADRVGDSSRPVDVLVNNAGFSVGAGLLSSSMEKHDRAAEVMDEDDPAVDQVDAARDEIDRLGRLVDGLLMLARADGREQETVPIDVSAVARDRVESWVPLAAERDITIVLDSVSATVAATSSSVQRTGCAPGFQERRASIPVKAKTPFSPVDERSSTAARGRCPIPSSCSWS